MNRSLDPSARAPWAESPDTVLEHFSSSREGLREQDVAERQRRFGGNQIRVPSRLTALALFLSQLKNPLIIALIIAGSIAVGISIWISPDDPKWVEAGVIFLAVVTNVGLGFWQEHKAERSLELLNSYTNFKAWVRRRDGEHASEIQVDARDLVVGDVVLLKQGNRIPADARLLSVNTLTVDEAPLTGESLPAQKHVAAVDPDAQPADRLSMVHSGTAVVEGFGEAVVTAIGAETEFGKIAELVADKQQEDTPLQRSIKQFATKAGVVLFGMGILLFVLGLLFSTRGLEDMFFIAVAAIVSAVPEGLPVAVTVVLAIGVERLARRKGVVRKLLAAETLGSTTTILTDKTGTLTEARMHLQEIAVLADIDESGILSRAVRNTDVTIENPDAEPSAWRMTGEPLEQAIVRAAGMHGVPVGRESSADIVDRLPFSADRKYSVTVARKADERMYTVTVVGAPEVLADLAQLSGEEREGILAEVESQARGGSRMLAVATAQVDVYDGDVSTLLETSGVTVAALLSFRDPIRMSVKGAIERISEAGVATVIVTGDHIGTATYVAKKLGIATNDAQVIGGADLDQLADEELFRRLDEFRVFARVTPAQKVRIVEAYKQRNEVVAVTGDGVNDAPALKTASIGVAMGAGTDVAKSAADLIILDNNYETIVAAIEEGRTIISNLRKVIIFLLSDSFDELVLIGGAIVAGIMLPLSAIQILFVKVFTDTLPALSFPFDRQSGQLNHRPEKLRRKLFDRETKVFTIGRGLFSAVLLFGIYIMLLQYTEYPDGVIRTFIFASFSTYILFLVFSLRSLSDNIWEYNPFSNWYINGGVLIGMAMTAVAIYVPLVRELLGTSYLPPVWLIWVAVIGLVNIASVELLKWWYKKS
ncbi:MAG: cation-transporting P-type ATPase [Candidatus Paceibacterota bacterium]